ncbi:threonine-phosphate decarboxylase [Shewanella canadensis]|uniref:threonine-phosphate decarboxylase n=1 Tax=Shewanella canadensis TaxID=271096 RepID=A0A431WQ91_9GAMM|nr:threonine-phosphate decarboxylase CobD [Shewanella canadensis]RTR37587.1 threonine-phosphate decarboxylase [Shewanella canadensis]
MTLLHHGGRLRDVAEKYGIDESDWLDLSTGVSPWHYPVPDIPPSCWNRLPEEEDGLIPAADRYYGGHNALAVAGSQAAIQCLPQVLTSMRDGPGRVLLPKVGYKEHERAWRMRGWQIEYYGNNSEHGNNCEYGEDSDKGDSENEAGDERAPESDQRPTPEQIDRCDVLLVINPNNPAAGLIPAAQLNVWLELLSEKNGFLVVDEAFMDMTPEASLNSVVSPNLVILRSIGKFFGLAGVRAGFVFAPQKVRLAMQELLGPWCLNGPARFVCTRAFADIEWQQMQINRLNQSSERLCQLLSSLEAPVVGTSLFQCVYLPQAPLWFERLCQHGILTRLTDERDALRFGLPADEKQWVRLTDVLQTVLAEIKFKQA